MRVVKLTEYTAVLGYMYTPTTVHTQSRDGVAQHSGLGRCSTMGVLTKPSRRAPGFERFGQLRLKPSIQSTSHSIKAPWNFLKVLTAIQVMSCFGAACRPQPLCGPCGAAFRGFHELPCTAAARQLQSQAGAVFSLQW